MITVGTLPIPNRVAIEIARNYRWAIAEPLWMPLQCSVDLPDVVVALPITDLAGPNCHYFGGLFHH